MHITPGTFADIIWKRVPFALPGLLKLAKWKPLATDRPQLRGSLPVNKAIKKKTELKYEDGQLHGHPIRAPGPSHI